MKKIILFAIILSAGAKAQTGVRILEPSFLGDGCNKHSASAAITDDGQTLSILFDNYSAQAGAPANNRQDRKACEVIIPVAVPKGYTAAVFRVDYRGFNALPAGAQSEFSVAYFFHGRQGPRLTTTFNGPLEQDFIVKNNVDAQSIVWGPCGRQMLLRAVSVMKNSTNAKREQALSTVDSADVQAGLVYQLQWKKCTE